jgi:hypothetical protein
MSIEMHSFTTLLANDIESEMLNQLEQTLQYLAEMVYDKQHVSTLNPEAVATEITSR